MFVDGGMSRESAHIDALRMLATHPAARGLMDDAAVLPAPPGDIVLTCDMIVEGVHFLANDPPGDVAWKLLAVNLSDLAAKGARPIGVLMGQTLGDPAWDAAFVDGLGTALRHYGVALLGGDTVAAASRVLALTAIGFADAGGAPDRRGAQAGDALFVTGAIGDAGLGLAIARGDRKGPERLRDAYRRPVPRIDAGIALAPHVHAMMDVSDGLLIDAARMAAASGLALAIDLDAVPLSDEGVAQAGDDRAARLAAASAGDDYELLFAAPEEAASRLLMICQGFGLRLSRIGRFDAGSGLAITDAHGMVPLPSRLGYEHDATPADDPDARHG